MKPTNMFIAALCIVLPSVPTSVFAQQGVTRTPLATSDFPAGYQTLSNIAQVAAGLCFGRHSHPGIESGYVLEGDLLLKIEGKPDQALKAGDPMNIPAGIPHVGCTTNGVKIFTVHIVEKGKPFATLLP